MLDELARYDIASEAGEPKWTLGTRPKADPKRLKDQAQPWDLRACVSVFLLLSLPSLSAFVRTSRSRSQVDDRSIVKIIPDRIYSMTVHPDPARSIVFAGDKNGHIACWDATDAGKLRPGKEAKAIRDGDAAKGGEAEDDEDEEDERQWGKWWHWKAHADSSVSFLKFRPGDRNAVRPASSPPLPCLLSPRGADPARTPARPQLYSSSYDGTLRATHFEHKQSEEVLDASRWNRDTLVHSFDFDATGNELWGAFLAGACVLARKCRSCSAQEGDADFRLSCRPIAASDDDGGLLFRDLRTPKDTTKRWEIDAYKGASLFVSPLTWQSQ